MHHDAIGSAIVEEVVMSRWTIVVFISLLAMSMPASASYIGIFLDAGATTCIAQVGSTPFIDLHVVAVLSGEVPVMMGAQFQITGAPEGWSSSNVLWVPADGTVNLGHPMFASPPRKRGVITAFSSCQGAEGEVTKVPLGRLILLGAPTPVNVHLRVQGFELVPIDPRCPFVMNCDIQAGYAKECVEGGEIVLNGDAATGCGVAVQRSTWTTVKCLYR